MNLSALNVPVSVQTTYSGSANGRPTLCQIFCALKENGFQGVELNIPDLYSDISPSELKKLLDSYELKMDYLATGGFAKKYSLSLSTPDENIRALSLEGLTQNIRYAAELRCGIILGFFKGTAIEDRTLASHLFLDSIQKTIPVIESYKVPVLLEVTNHMESSVLNTLEEGALVVDKIGSPYVSLLADTYHMSIDEDDILSSLQKYLNYFPHLHLSDNTRTFPGFGTLNFQAIVQTLKNINYHGTFALEGNPHNGLLEDIALSAAYLIQFF